MAFLSRLVQWKVGLASTRVRAKASAEYSDPADCPKKRTDNRENTSNRDVLRPRATTIRFPRGARSEEEPSSDRERHDESPTPAQPLLSRSFQCDSRECEVPRLLAGPSIGADPRASD